MFCLMFLLGVIQGRVISILINLFIQFNQGAKGGLMVQSVIVIYSQGVAESSLVSKLFESGGVSGSPSCCSR